MPVMTLLVKIILNCHKTGSSNVKQLEEVCILSW